MFRKCRHTVTDDGNRLGMHRSLLLLELGFMTASAILGRNYGSDHAAFMLYRIRVIFVCLVAVKAIDVCLGMGAIFPLPGQPGRRLAMAIHAGLAFLGTPAIGVQGDLGCQHRGTGEQPQDTCDNNQAGK